MIERNKFMHVDMTSIGIIFTRTYCTLLVFLYLGIVIVIIVCCAITEYYTQHFQQKQISCECEHEAIVKFLLYKLVLPIKNLYNLELAALKKVIMVLAVVCTHATVNL